MSKSTGVPSLVSVVVQVPLVLQVERVCVGVVRKMLVFAEAGLCSN